MWGYSKGFEIKKAGDYSRTREYESVKSLADNFASAKKIVTACQKNNVVLYENFMCDFHPQHQAVLDLIKKGEIGKPFIFYSSFGIPPRDKHDIRYDKKLGGGALNDIGAYTIFMARKILRNEPLTVDATLYRNKVDGVDLKGAILLKFPNEILAMLAFSFDAIYQNNYLKSFFCPISYYKQSPRPSGSFPIN